MNAENSNITQKYAKILQNYLLENSKLDIIDIWLHTNFFWNIIIIDLLTCRDIVYRNVYSADNMQLQNYAGILICKYRYRYEDRFIVDLLDIYKDM